VLLGLDNIACQKFESAFRNVPVADLPVARLCIGMQHAVTLSIVACLDKLSLRKRNIAFIRIVHAAADRRSKEHTITSYAGTVG